MASLWNLGNLTSFDSEAGWQIIMPLGVLGEGIHLYNFTEIGPQTFEKMPLKHAPRKFGFSRIVTSCWMWRFYGDPTRKRCIILGVSCKFLIKGVAMWNSKKNDEGGLSNCWVIQIQRWLIVRFSRTHIISWKISKSHHDHINVEIFT